MLGLCAIYVHKTFQKPPLPAKYWLVKQKYLEFSKFPSPMPLCAWQAARALFTFECSRSFTGQPFLLLQKCRMGILCYISFYFLKSRISVKCNSCASGPSIACKQLSSHAVTGLTCTQKSAFPRKIAGWIDCDYYRVGIMLAVIPLRMRRALGKHIYDRK